MNLLADEGVDLRPDGHDVLYVAELSPSIPDEDVLREANDRAPSSGAFTSEARKEATRDGVPPIELVDGEKIINMFVDLELGLKPVTSYEVNEGFFEEIRK